MQDAARIMSFYNDNIDVRSLQSAKMKIENALRALTLPVVEEIIDEENIEDIRLRQLVAQLRRYVECSRRTREPEDE